MMLSMTPASAVSRPVSSKSMSSARLRMLPVGSKRSFSNFAKQQRVHASSNSEPTSDDAAAPVEALTSSPGAVALTAAVKPEETNLFLDPLVRSLLLGVGAGMACETLHVVLKAVSMLEAGALLKPFSIDIMQQLGGPAFMADHAVAIGAWILLYAVEAAAIVSLMNRNPGAQSADSELTSALSFLPTRKMFPAPLTPVKDALAYTLAAGASAGAAIGNGAAAAEAAISHAAAAAVVAASASVAQQQAQASAAPSKVTAAPPGLSKELEKVLDDIETAAAGSSRGTSGGSNVAEPEQQQEQKTKQKPSPTPKAQKPGPIKRTESLKRQQQQEQQQEEVGKKLSRRDQELKDRKSYLKNFWYAAALSQNVKDKPVGVDILGSRITLFRDETGKVVAVDDTCPHRGAPLSDGWTHTDKATGKKCVVCPYHGWAFDAEGKLRDVPSAEHNSWPKRALIGAYDVEEQGGFVWLFYGSKSMPASERPPIPFTDELADPNWRAVYGEIEFDCGHWGVFENAIDMAHIHYLHADSFGNSEKPKVMEMKSERDTFATTCTFRIHNKPVNKMWEWTAVPSVPVTAKAMLPSTSAVTIELAHGVKMITFVNTVPINEHKAINRFCLIRNFATNPAFDFMARDNMYKILGEDKVMVDKLAPERLEQEYSLAPDLPQIAFRQLRQEWIDMGYGVPPVSEQPRRGLLPRDC